ncbi:hypothetical protein KM1_229620 [Entamoeba histolytica HM-3:IMSS]|uniref:Uncharacterized protein n=1 Tax=Entamoeba histolytica HM-3:IMSS TaxID=885315 RepID=M7W562_ENTHI|nr:hypothetical protein KM1_229620 [Entamoeba histolytica HM-3:IMSS]
MNTPTETKKALKGLVNQLVEEIRLHLSSNITREGESLLIALFYWVRRLDFNEEYEYNSSLANYLPFFLEDIKCYLVRFDKLERTIQEISTLYVEENFN